MCQLQWDTDKLLPDQTLSGKDLFSGKGLLPLKYRSAAPVVGAALAPDAARLAKRVNQVTLWRDSPPTEPATAHEGRVSHCPVLHAQINTLLGALVPLARRPPVRGSLAALVCTAPLPLPMELVAQGDVLATLAPGVGCADAWVDGGGDDFEFESDLPLVHAEAVCAAADRLLGAPEELHAGLLLAEPAHAVAVAVASA